MFVDRQQKVPTVVIHTMAYYSRNNEITSHIIHRQILNTCCYIKKKDQANMTVHCIIPIIRHSMQGKIAEIISTSQLPEMGKSEE